MHLLVALRLTWLMAAVGIVTSAVWTALDVLVGWPWNSELVRPVLSGTTLRIASMGGPNRPPYEFSTQPSVVLWVAVTLLAVLVGLLGGWLQRRMIRRSSAFSQTPGEADDYRTTISRFASPERATGATVRAFGLRLGVTMAFAIGLAAWAGARLKPPFGTSMAGLEAQARHLSRAFEGFGITLVALALLVTVWPARRRLEPPMLPPTP